MQNQSWAVTLRCWFGLSKEIVRSNPCSRLQSRNAPVNWITAFDLIKKPIRYCKTSFHPASRVALYYCFAEPLVCYRPHLVGEVIHNQVISLGCKHFWCISENSKVVYLGEGSLEKFAIQIKLSLTNHPRDTIAHTLGSLRLASQNAKILKSVLCKIQEVAFSGTLKTTSCQDGFQVCLQWARSWWQLEDIPSVVQNWSQEITKMHLRTRWSGLRRHAGLRVVCVLQDGRVPHEGVIGDVIGTGYISTSVQLLSWSRNV